MRGKINISPILSFMSHNNGPIFIIGFYYEMMLIGVTDTLVLTVEWAMSSLLNHPQVLVSTR